MVKKMCSFHFPIHANANAWPSMVDECSSETILPRVHHLLRAAFWDVRGRLPWRLVMQVVKLDPERMAQVAFIPEQPASLYYVMKLRFALLNC